MHVVHTAAVPPNHGKICLAISGCTRKIRNADSEMTNAKCMDMTQKLIRRAPIFPAMVSGCKGAGGDWMFGAVVDGDSTIANRVANGKLDANC